MDYKNVVLKQDVQASLADRKFNAVRQAVEGLVRFIITTFEEHGIDKLHEMADPSLDEMTRILDELAQEATALVERNENLERAIHLAQVMIQDVKQKNPDLCANGAKMLKTVNVD
ncbi:hypothetical protein [Aeromonas salmonicida]|uniref:hypothetical protein n=1 Tax=Aeromonas salmonicida TaxID=645 RepID=UPI003D25EE60